MIMKKGICGPILCCLMSAMVYPVYAQSSENTDTVTSAQVVSTQKKLSTPATDSASASTTQNDSSIPQAQLNRQLLEGEVVQMQHQKAFEGLTGSELNELAKRQEELNQQIAALKSEYENPSALQEGTEGLFHDRLIFSGGIMSQLQVSNGTGPSNFNGQGTKTLSLNTAFIDLHGILTTNWSAFTSVSFSPGQVNTEGTYGGVDFEQAYVSYVKRFSDTRLSFDLGKQYVPFGVYEHHPITNSLTQVLDETVKESAVLSLSHAPFFGSVYMFNAQGSLQGPDATGDSAIVPNQIYNGGVELGAINKQGFFGYDLDFGYNNNLAESEQIYALMPTTTHRVGAYAAHVMFSIGDLGLLGDGAYAATNFSSQDATYNGSGAQPWAYGLEINYRVPLFSRPGTLAFDYQGSGQALFLNLPRTRYDLNYTYSINHYVSMVAEFIRSQDYGKSAAASYTNSSQATEYVYGTAAYNNTGLVELTANF